MAAKHLTRGPDKVQMHFHFDFSARQILWTLTFAAQLVLLVVLLGRDRMRRYPWFTAAIVFSAVQLMAEVLLVGRMAMIPLQEILITLADLAVIVNLLVLVEVARRAFAGVQRSLWLVNTAGLLVVAGGILAFWGPWPTKSAGSYADGGAGAAGDHFWPPLQSRLAQPHADDCHWALDGCCSLPVGTGFNAVHHQNGASSNPAGA